MIRVPAHVPYPEGHLTAWDILGLVIAVTVGTILGCVLAGLDGVNRLLEDSLW